MSIIPLEKILIYNECCPHAWKNIYADDSISGGNSYPANRVSYDNTGTDLESTTVQDAITEIINGGTENIFDGSIEDWNLLSTAEKTAYDHAMINNDYSDNPVGNLNALTTTDKTSIVGGVNEINSNTGNLSNLTTTDKSSCVAAINEVNSAKAKKYTYYTSATGVNSIDLTQISFDELKIVVIAPLTGYSCVFELHVFKTDLSSTYLYYSTGNNTSTIKVGITQSLCILNTSICEGADVINDTVIKVYYR